MKFPGDGLKFSICEDAVNRQDAETRVVTCIPIEAWRKIISGIHQAEAASLNRKCAISLSEKLSINPLVAHTKIHQLAHALQEAAGTSENYGNYYQQAFNQLMEV